MGNIIDTIQQSVSINFDSVKEPRGFLRIIQFVLSILAFSTICGPKPHATVNMHCGTTNSSTPETLTLNYPYPFRLNHEAVKVPCSGFVTFVGSAAGSAQFFCFIGVMSFLICMGLLVLYIVFSHLITSKTRSATIEFIFSLVWTVLWFIASTAWAAELTTLGSSAAPDNLIAILKDHGFCKLPCTAGDEGDHSTLVVSVLFGYLNMGVWAAGLWFLFKETTFHNEDLGDTQNLEGQPGAAAGGSYQSPDYPQAPSTDTAPNY